MLAIHATAAVISVAVLFAIHQYVKRTVGRMQWADSRHAYNFQRIRELVFEMQASEPHPRDWRPQILVLSKDTERRQQVLSFGSWIEGGSGITSLVSIVESSEPNADAVKERVLTELSQNIEDWEIEAFPLVVKAKSFREGMEVLLQTLVEGRLDGKSVSEQSSEASVVFIPVRLEGGRLTDILRDPLDEMNDRGLAVALVLAGKDIELEAEPDEQPAEEGV